MAVASLDLKVPNFNFKADTRSVMHYNTTLDQKWINMYNSLLSHLLEIFLNSPFVFKLNKFLVLNKMYGFDAEKL